MESKHILGLDLGTNSIGWALVEQNSEKREGKIVGMGSRIIPMSQEIIGKFQQGNIESQTAARTGYRGVRRLRQRHLLRRERLHRVLNILDFLPQHYQQQIDFEKRLGQFKEGTEPKLVYENGKFLFLSSFQEMIEDFKIHQPHLLNRKNRNGEDAKIPYDWTIYYLRKKALNHKINKEEIAWILLNFNQKRGYYQLRGEEEEDDKSKCVEYHALIVKKVIPDEDLKGGKGWYTLLLDNGWEYRRKGTEDLLEWENKSIELIVTTKINDDGSIKLKKDGSEDRSFRAPKEDDWTLVKKKTEDSIDKSGKTVGEYIYETLLQNPNQKIRGKLIKTIERKLYKEELYKILNKQIELQPELFTQEMLEKCIQELYQYNNAHRFLLSNKNFSYLFVDDIIFYQRPLKSKKSLISRCTLESRKYKQRNEDGEIEEKVEFLKAIPKSHPLYQEFRIWQWLHYLKIYKKEDEKDVTVDFINSVEEKEALFDFLMNNHEVESDDVIKFLLKTSDLKGKALKTEIAKYRWNYVYDSATNTSKKYPMNNTRYEIKKRLDKVQGLPNDFLNEETEKWLWHIIYSVTDKNEYEKALKNFAKRNTIDSDSFVEGFKKIPPFKKEYGAFSEKAIKKLLPLVRIGKHWDWNNINTSTKEGIQKILDGEFDENINEKVREFAQHLEKEEDFQGLQTWFAQYVVYNRHSETLDLKKWSQASDITWFLDAKNPDGFKQHSLRNPIVEQVVTETLRVVRDIWNEYGQGNKDFFNEIHIELGRDMKNSADKRKRLSENQTKNENTNLRIKALLAEMYENNVENVRPYSPLQQEILKIYEDGVLRSQDEIDDDILKISRTAQPKKSELNRYKLWLEQKYVSPYTGQIIPLSKLFTSAYEIEHIIPKSRYFDNGFNNKIICEAEVNRLKDNMLGHEFIVNHGGEVVDCGQNKTVTISSLSAYEAFVKKTYKNNRVKRTNLLLDEVPEKMIERQMNDTRYISKYISRLLSKIVRSDEKDDGFNSKNIIPLNGKITTRLKQDWRLNDKWNNIILPRFERMNELTNSDSFTSWNEKHRKYLPTVPIELSKGFSKKRIDHRHHAMDALVIACATRSHVNLLNNENANSEHKRHDLNRKLRQYKKVKYKDAKTGKLVERDVPKEFLLPWNNFPEEAEQALRNIVVSFKQNLRVINKATNYYESYKDENGNIRRDANGNPKKGTITQKGTNWAIRKPLHKETVSGKVKLPRIKVTKGKILTASRQKLDISFKTSKIESITDESIQSILLNHLEKFDETEFEIKESNLKERISRRKQLIKKEKLIEHPKIAFSPVQIVEMNKNIQVLNNGKFHHPIQSVRIFEMGSKFPLGETGNKMDKYVEAAKGTNLYFAIYQKEDGSRNFETIPLNIVIERQKQGLGPVPEQNEKGEHLLFYLSPNDLVYVPKEGGSFNKISPDCAKIYKVVSFSGKQLFLVHYSIASTIKDKYEFSPLNKMERAIDGIMIKNCCFKLKVNRLGHIL